MRKEEIKEAKNFFRKSNRRIDKGTGTGSVRNAYSTLERWNRVLDACFLNRHLLYDVRNAVGTLYYVYF